MNGTTIPTGRDTTYDSSEVYRPEKEDEGGSGGGGLTRTVHTIESTALNPFIDVNDRNWASLVRGVLSAGVGFANITLTLNGASVTLPLLVLSSDLVVAYSYLDDSIVTTYRGTWDTRGDVIALFHYRSDSGYQAMDEFASLVPTVVELVAYME